MATFVVVLEVLAFLFEDDCGCSRAAALKGFLVHAVLYAGDGLLLE